MRINTPALLLSLSAGCLSPCNEPQGLSTQDEPHLVPVEMAVLHQHRSLVDALELNLFDFAKAESDKCDSQLGVWITEAELGTYKENPDLFSPDLIFIRIGLSAYNTPEIKECTDWLKSIEDLDALRIFTSYEAYDCNRIATSVVRPFPHAITQQDIIVTYECTTDRFPQEQRDQFEMNLPNPNSMKRDEMNIHGDNSIDLWR